MISRPKKYHGVSKDKMVGLDNENCGDGQGATMCTE
jgi:hypothetical protein